MRTIIETENLIKTFQNGKETSMILKQLNFSVKEGEFVSIMGPSGCGKSTLLYLLGGLDLPTSGSVKFNGEDLGKMKAKELSKLRRRELGFVFQFYNLVPNLTVEENILLPILLDGHKTKAYQKQLEEMLEIIGMSERAKYTPRELSGGQQQRVAIARALLHNPKLILADEPIGNLDSKSGKEVMKLFGKINREFGSTIIQVTHSEESALYGSRILRMKDGKIISQEQVEEIKKYASFS